MRTYNQIITVLNDFATNHLQVNSFFRGNVNEIGFNNETYKSFNYPIMWVQDGTETISDKDAVISFEILLLDIEYPDHKTQQEILSDMREVALDLASYLYDINKTADFEFTIDRNISLQPFKETYEDNLTGWLVTVPIRQTFVYDRCQIPLSGATGTGESYVTIYDTDGITILTTVPCGGRYTVTGGGGPCLDATAVLKNTDDTVLSSTDIPSGTSADIQAPDATWTLENTIRTQINTGTIPSGNSDVIVAPDETINVVDQNDVLQQTLTFPVYENQQIDISTYCDDATAVLKNTAGTTLSTTNIPSGTSDDIIAPDSTFSINGTQVATIPSGDSDSIEVRKQNTSDQIGSLQGQFWRVNDSVITLKDTANNTLSTTNVPATEAQDITAPDGTVNVNKSDTTLISSVTVLSGGTNAYNVADSTGVLKDTAGTIISTTSIKATESQDITAPDGTVNVNKSDSTLISAQTVLSNGTTNYNVADSTAVLKDTAGVTLSTTAIKATESEDITAPDADVENSDASYTDTIESGSTLVVPDSDINVNSSLEGTVVSIKTIDINLTDGTSTVTPTSVSVSGNVVDIEVPAAGGAPVGATLMKTGQTTSYRTGDDGDLEAGRATDFFTLASNNPFGNTNRFTDELGGTTYTNDIVIDWSTYDGSTVLGWRRTTNGVNINWDDSIDNALLTSIGTFTSGWRLPNINELLSIINWEAQKSLNYSPFNENGAFFFWTSTTRSNLTSRAYTFGHNGYIIQATTKTSTTGSRYIPCRTFTVTGTTLS